MSWEIITLIAAVLLVLLDFILLGRGTLKERKPDRGLIAAAVAFGLILLAMLLFAWDFIIGNFSLIEVYSYSSTGLAAMAKIYATWGGAGGSMLFLALVIGLIYFLYRYHTSRSRTSLNINASMIYAVVLMVFLAVTLALNPFETFQTMPLNGLGLNPQLQTIWMVIHPPVVLSAHALVLFIYALTLASMRTGAKVDQTPLFRASTYLAWMLFTLGIALGALWAYGTMGWGGYWSWDPVETASLLPWIALTVYFHLGRNSNGKKTLTREVVVLITFASLVFLTALTRGGFTSSVHSYAISLIGPILLTFALGMTIYFFYLKRRIRKPLFALKREHGLPYASSLLMIFALAMIFLVCLMGILVPLVVSAVTGQTFPLGADYYNIWNFPFLILLVVGLIGCNLPATAGFRAFFGLVAVGGIAGLVAAILSVPTSYAYVDFGVPLLLIALAAVIYRFGAVLSVRKNVPMQLGRSIIHIGLVILLLGILISAGGEGSSTILATTNSGVQGPVSLWFGNATLSQSSTTVYYPRLDGVIQEFSSVGIDTIVAFNGQIYYAVLEASFYPNYGLLFRPLIISTLQGDLYIHLDYTDSLYNSLVSIYLGQPLPPTNISVTVISLPMVYLVWAGVILLNIGITFSLINEVMDYRRRRQDSPSFKGQGM